MNGRVCYYIDKYKKLVQTIPSFKRASPKTEREGGRQMWGVGGK